MKVKSIYLILFLLLLQVQSSALADFEPELGNPDLNYTDGNFVNALTGTINYQISDLSIGSGKHALSHSLSVNSTNILNYGYKNTGTPRFWGYKDKYIGGIYRQMHTEIQPGQTGASFYVIHVFDDLSSYNFVIDESSNNFINIKDPKVTLTVNSDRKGYTLTRADGTKVFYVTKNNASIPFSLTKNFNGYGIMHKIVYPDNFTVTIHRDDNSGIESPIRSVTSNNGLQLKYIYQNDTRTIPSPLKQKLTDAGYSTPEAYALNLSKYMPIKIIALNNAVETCPLLANSCNPQHVWAKTTYSWPVGAPYSMFVADSDFEVTDMQGLITTFKHYAHYYLAGFRFPRIKEISTNQGLKVTYEYLKRFEDEQEQHEKDKEMWQLSNRYYSWGDQSGKLKKSTGPAGTFSYATEGSKVFNTTFASPMVFQNSTTNGAGGVTEIVRMYSRNDMFYPGAFLVNTAPTYIETWDKEIVLEESLENKPIKVTDKLTGIITDYSYDQMGRVKNTNSDGLKKTFNYPYSYTGGCDVDTSYCNKPVSVSNHYIFTSQRTYTLYSYHAESGKISSIKHPKDPSGVAPTVEFEYAQYTPRYIDSSGRMSSGISGIWLKKKKIMCENSALSEGNCSGNDKVTETYDYGSGDANNLFLIGKTVTGQRDGLTRKFCYTYDRFGNMIGETQPKANVTCNTIRGF